VLIKRIYCLLWLTDQVPNNVTLERSLEFLHNKLDHLDADQSTAAAHATAAATAAV